MTLPSFPTMPVIHQVNRPKLSGIFPPRAFVLMFVASIPISLLLGVVVHYVGGFLASIGLGLLFLKGEQQVGVGINWTFIAHVLAFIFMVVMLFYPYIMGYLDGQMIIGQLGKFGHCRNPRIAGLAGAFSGVLIYLGHLILSWITYGRLSSLIIPTQTVEGIFDSTIAGTPWWGYVLIVFEAVTLIIGSSIAAKRLISGSYYCETHKTWFSAWSLGWLTLESAWPIADAITSEKVSGLKNVSQGAIGLSHIEIKARSCPSDPNCFMEMSARIKMKELSRNSRGKSEFFDDWFDILLPADFGRSLEKMLKLEAPKSKDKKPAATPAAEPVTELLAEEELVCDLCNASGRGKMVKALSMRRAVQGGFNPYKEGLVPDISRMFGQGNAYDSWRDSVINGDLSKTDWNICDGCMIKLKPYLI
jgi:hypothetical protein